MNDLEWDLGIQLPSAAVPVVVCGGTSGALAAKNQLLRRSFVFFLSIEEYPNHNQGDLISDTLQAGIWKFSQRKFPLEISLQELRVGWGRERERSVLQSSFKMTFEACFCNENHLLIFCIKNSTISALFACIKIIILISFYFSSHCVCNDN
jgi:hypothetical protein